MRRVAVVTLAVTSVLACAVGVGEGQVRGQARVPLCRIDGEYDLEASFYGAMRDGRALTIRIQPGGGPPDYTDHLYVRVDDTEEVHRRLVASPERDAQNRPVVTLRVAPSGTPGVLVHALFSPVRTCGRTKVTRLGQNVGLWAYDGAITFRSIDRGDAPPGGGTGTAEDRLTDVAAFEFRLHDPRPVGTPAPDWVSPDDPVGEAELRGHFRFYYSRGAAAQLFP